MITDSSVEFDYYEFISRLNAESKIVLYGAASNGRKAALNLVNMGIPRSQMNFCDSNSSKWGTEIEGVAVISVADLKILGTDTLILITSIMYPEIEKQLSQEGFSHLHYIHSLLYKRSLMTKYSEAILVVFDKVRFECCLDDEEKFTILSSMKSVASLPGEVAEVGVYKAGTSKVLCEYKGDKELHLFDTFEGLPEQAIRAEDLVKSGWLSDTSVEAVAAYLNEYDNVYIHQGFFPDTSGPIVDKQFCLVHLDVDAYQGTIDSLNFFWPRMVSGGRVIVHDYNNADCPGVKVALEEFFADRMHLVIDIADSQALIVKDC